MDTFILHVRRQAGITAAAAATKIILDGNTVAKLRVGGSQDLTLPRKPVNVMLLTQVSLGKNIEKSFVIDPRDSQDVTLLFTYKFNAKSLIPFGAFSQQQSFIETEVIHGPSVSSSRVSTANTSYSSGQSQQQSSSTSGNNKFCTECGTPNHKTAKFCQNCGHKF